MTTRQIDCAIELAHTLNFRKASENCNISQPGLSYQIQTLEEEAGFTIFLRSGKGANLTPAGAAFISELVKIKENLRRATENARNISHGFSDSLSVSLPLRSALCFLPQIMKNFKKEFPHVLLNIQFQYGKSRTENFLTGNTDVMFGRKNALSHIPQIELHTIFQSHIYLIVQKEDSLAKKEIITPQDFKGRTLLVGGGSPPELKKAQETVINSVHPETMNSEDHFTTLTNVAAGNGVCLSPGFCNDRTEEFVWLPITFGTPIECVLATRSDDHRETTKRFIKITKEIYEAHNAEKEML
ncbi:LysR family transcriptional regulator [Treponema succinifaciens]|uniref:LysR family transcriptional regulator n=1 Tax=Treponema succinifaciens TaxID=167 RepID=UPI0023F23F4F|nr:LysR family transcriptional regulator [Treponema succinifaciens]